MISVNICIPFYNYVFPFITISIQYFNTKKEDSNRIYSGTKCQQISRQNINKMSKSKKKMFDIDFVITFSERQ